MEVTYLLSELESVAREVLRNSKSKILLFYGQMGSGKTTLINQMLRTLGAADTGSSPTFSLVNEYETPEGNVYHFDFYRIEDESEAWDMGFEEYLESDNWIFIEWPEKVEKFLEETYQKVKIEVVNEGVRKLKFC